MIHDVWMPKQAAASDQEHVLPETIGAQADDRRTNIEHLTMELGHQAAQACAVVEGGCALEYGPIEITGQ